MGTLSGMQLVFHGGLCCGIKTIYRMGYGPDAPEHENPALEKVPINNIDQCGGDVSSDERFFHMDAPEESGKDRLDRYIEYMKKYRPKNVLEVVLAESAYRHSCQMVWKPILEERGFKCVTSHKNSNSGNTIHIFHLLIDEDYLEDEDDDYDEDYDDYFDDED